MKKIAIIGNCQSDGIAAAFEMLTGVKVEPTRLALKRGQTTIKEIAANFDLLFCSIHNASHISRLIPTIGYLPITFSGFHPDDVTFHGPRDIRSPLGNNHSAIVLWSFLNGLTTDQAISLFTGDVFSHLGYYDTFEVAKRYLLREFAAIEFPLDAAVDKWIARGSPFMHVPLHPKGFVLADLAAMLAQRIGLPITGSVPDDFDPLSHAARWPVYPEIAERLGMIRLGDYWFDRKGKFAGNLKVFVEKSYAAYATYEGLECDRLKDPRYADLHRFLPAKKVVIKGNPYRSLPNHCWWKRAVAEVPADAIDPVVSPRFKLSQDTKVATAGSCFAQHISRSLRESGYTYLSTEDPPAQAIFSARFGNIYTARQLLQLWRRAQGLFSPKDEAWSRPDGRLTDPFRPKIEPAGFGSIEELRAARDRHLAAVREMFAKLDVLVFTLGLTEAWRSKVDGAVFPLPPTSVTSSVDPEDYEFVNFDVDSVRADLFEFLDCLKASNRETKVLLTVSPVPLIATYEHRHVLVSTSYSKAVLRVAAESCIHRYDWVDYLPSYEIITSSASHGTYFADDLRSITPEGVSHVMRVFFRHYASGAVSSSSRAESEFLENSRIICEEEEIERSAVAG